MTDLILENSDPEADQGFHALTKGSQRGLIYLVLWVKSTNRRMEEALKMARYTKAGITSPQAIVKLR